MTALLLGLGGAAMWRFMRAYVPECAMTLVDNDETVAAIAKRWFYLSQPVVLDTRRAVSRGRDAEIRRDSRRSLHFARPRRFRRAVLDPLPRRAGAGRLPCDQLGRFRQSTGRCGRWPTASSKWRKPAAFPRYYVTRRGFHDNLVQYLPTAAGHSPETLIPSLEEFARTRRLPDRGRGILESCIISERFPLNT